MFFTLGLKKLPFEPVEKQIIFVENGYDEEVNRYIQKNYEAIRSHFQERGYEFCYLPKITEEILKKEVIEYNAPYAQGFESDVTFSSDFLLNYLIHQEEREKILPSLVFYNPKFKDDNYPQTAYLYQGIILNHESGYQETDCLSNILSRITRANDTMTKRYRIGCGRLIKRDYLKAYIDHESIDFKDSNKPEASYEEYDSEIQQMMEEMKALAEKLKKSGLSEHLLEKLIHGDEKMSRLYITKDYRLFLLDYQNKEVRMTPIHKALYLLFLKYPDGLFFHDLVDYREELMELYKKIKGGLFYEKSAQNSIDKLTNHLDNSIYEKISRIKESFTIHIHDRLAKYYYIDGKKNEVKKILLPRELVVWEICP